MIAHSISIVIVTAQNVLRMQAWRRALHSSTAQFRNVVNSWLVHTLLDKAVN